MRIELFAPEHFQRLILQPSQAIMQPMLNDQKYAERLFRAGPAFSAIVDDEVIATLGIIPQWDNRAVAWGLVGEKAKDHLLGVHRGVSKFLNGCGYRRIETSVATHFEEGHRWARLLGFEREGTMRAFHPNGDDCDLYARIAR